MRLVISLVESRRPRPVDAAPDFPLRRSIIEKLRLENEKLKGELNLDQRQSRMLDSESSQILFQAVEKDAVLVARRIDELKTKAAVRFLHFLLIRTYNQKIIALGFVSSPYLRGSSF